VAWVGWRLEGPTVGSVFDHSTALEIHERLSETVVVDAEHVPEFDSGLRRRRTGQRSADSLCEGRCGRLDVSLFDHLKVGLTALVDEAETDRVGRRRCPVLESQLEGLVFALTDKIRGRVRPRVKVAAAAQCLPEIGSAPFAHVVDQGDSNTMGALKAAQIPEKCGHIGTAILVQSVQPHEGIEHQQHGLELCDGCLQTLLVSVEIQTQSRRGDDVEVSRIQHELASLTECSETLPYLREPILGEVNKSTARLMDLEALEAQRR